MRISILAVPVIASLLTGGCSRNGAPSPGRSQGGTEAVPVTVAPVTERPMPVELRLVGTVEPSSTVGVRALVGGELKAVHFQEGQEVRKDDLLFTIDPRPFEAQLHQAEANLARDKAQAENADAQVRRYKDLVSRGIATREQLDQLSSTAAALAATVKADTAAVENATLQLGYSTVRSPIGGRTGALIVHAGNVVATTDTTPLVVINQISPVFVAFPIAERDLPDIRRYEAAGTLHVEAQIPGDEAHVERGTISFLDNAVDPATGTIKLKGTFANEDRRLWPGLFVNIVLTLRTEPRALVIPARAVQDGQDGKYVYVVKADRTVESRSVDVARTMGLDAVIARGLAVGETVVTDGQLRLVAGRRVRIQDQPGERRRASQP